MTDPSKNTPFGDTLASFGLIQGTYVVKTDGWQMYITEDFSDALQEFHHWVMQLQACCPNVGDKVTLEILL